MSSTTSHPLPIETDDRPIRVALVDDHPAVRAGLEVVLADDPRIAVVASAATAREAYRQIERERPDLAIVDYNLPGEDGISLCYRLKSLPSPPHVLILSAFADDALALKAAVAGADGVMSKAAPADLYDTAAALMGGERLVTEISPDVLEQSGSKLDAQDLPILGMLLHGISPDDIADALDVDPSRLAVRRWAMLDRLRDRAEAR